MEMISDLSVLFSLILFFLFWGKGWRVSIYKVKTKGKKFPL